MGFRETILELGEGYERGEAYGVATSSATSVLDTDRYKSIVKMNHGVDGTDAIISKSGRDPQMQAGDIGGNAVLFQ